MTSKEFNNYVLYHENDPDSKIKMTIHCFYDDVTVGYIRFHEGKVPAPVMMQGGSIEIHFPADRMFEIVTTIRYEKPLFISATGKKSIISTVKEPVGEQEGI